MVGRLDANQDGVITSDEVENAPEFARRMLQDSGLDFRRGVRVEDLQQSAQQRMEEMRRQRDGERPERSESSERPDRPDRPDWAPPQSTGSGDFSEQATPGNQRGSSAPSIQSPAGNSRPRTRVSPLLPDSFLSYDMDQDGQIALSEWRKGKRGPISQFMQYDLDGDGFLIAKELMKASAIAAAPSATAPATPSPTQATATTNVANPTTPTPPAASPTSMAPVTVSATDALKATGAFDLLDTDKSGTVAGEEWSKSRRLKPLFEKAGYDLAKPMNKDEFTQGFVRVGGAK